MKEINARFKPAGIGGGPGCSCNDERSSRHKSKCRSQRIPLRADVPAPTVVGGEVTQVATFKIEPEHYADIFDPDTMFLVAEFVNEDGNLTDANEAYVRFITIGRDHYDCLAEDEPYGIPALAYAQTECCDGKPLCVPPFRNKKDNEKEALAIEIVNNQTETLGDGSVVGRAVRIRGYITGECRECGYQKHCPTPPAAAPAA